MKNRNPLGGSGSKRIVSPNEKVNDCELDKDGWATRVAVTVRFDCVIPAVANTRAAATVGVPVRMSVEEASDTRTPDETGVPVLVVKVRPSGREPKVYRIVPPVCGYGGARAVSTWFEIAVPTAIKPTSPVPDRSRIIRSAPTPIVTRVVMNLVAPTLEPMMR